MYQITYQYRLYQITYLLYSIRTIHSLDWDSWRKLKYLRGMVLWVHLVILCSSKISVWIKFHISSDFISLYIPLNRQIPEMYILVLKYHHHIPLFFFSLLCFYLGFTTCEDYFTHFEPSQSLDGAKTGDLQEKYLTTSKQNWACLTCDPN